MFLWIDAAHFLEFFVAGSSITAWVQNGAAATNLTPLWPRYSATTMQWLRFRESGGVLVWEYASGATAPGAWTTLASTPVPFSMSAVRLRLAAGSNASASDIATFDNVATT